MSIAGRRLSLKLSSSATLLALALFLPANAFAACVNDPDTAQKAAAFTTNPSSLLEGANGPRSPDDVAADVQTFVASYPQALPAVLAILKDLANKGGATAALQKAIGTGLGKAANVCKTTDLTFALEIQGDLGATGSSDANAQYAALTGNDPTRSVALSGATTGSSGGVGGQTSATGGTFGVGSSFQTFVANSVSNNPTSYFSSSVGGASSAGGTSTTIVCTVSGSC
ncbi:hypothetical protein [Bradyrhizobium liaoningense]|uniref:hypothetical protein n=1 Tax=Bradyrhizobium liaoningense TaxID=43992 RepID=UPI001BAC3BBE|nr:hypothetical protein [Bradyrhizobium liaoningense]MBR1171009.1 hypothetical protein [Bradyrhizobium liaoningense]